MVTLLPPLPNQEFASVQISEVNAWCIDNAPHDALRDAMCGSDEEARVLSAYSLHYDRPARHKDHCDPGTLVRSYRNTKPAF